MNRLSLHNRPEDPQPTLDLRGCQLCRDMGYTLPDEFRADAPGIPAGILFRYGVPCQCAAGRQFAKAQENWNRPVPRFDIGRIIEAMPAKWKDNPWPPPPWSDPPRKPATVLRPKLVTQEEIDAILKQQKENQGQQ